MLSNPNATIPHGYTELELGTKIRGTDKILRYNMPVFVQVSTLDNLAPATLGQMYNENHWTVIRKDPYAKPKVTAPKAVNEDHIQFDEPSKLWSYRTAEITSRSVTGPHKEVINLLQNLLFSKCRNIGDIEAVYEEHRAAEGVIVYSIHLFN